ncbi:hypothetical protein AL036_16100 [Salipiger aestuarii]|uniref:hypothetical protein n=1 Tax=Salipiger aestuarii TaxID=568098 RepID=UPI00123BA92F|nr:hypothetical protein [Salipiger aestuarii]KAA8606054.1 hypothetical protein AL036_16100 [Salipiger aestuarii]
MAIPDVTGSTIPRHGKPEAGGGDCECRLTKADRLGIERFLSFAGNSSVAYSQLMLDILHQKLQVAVAIEGAAPSDVATFGSYISCVVDEKDIECGVLSFGLVARAGEIPIHSLLGATLIGMSAGQRTKLRFEGGTTRSLVVIHVSVPFAV